MLQKAITTCVMYSTCNEILRRVGITTAAMKKLTIINYDSLCSYYCLTYPVYKVHSPNYVVICDLSDSITSCYLISYTPYSS